jgi:hypothetical protein
MINVCLVRVSNELAPASYKYWIYFIVLGCIQYAHFGNWLSNPLQLIVILPTPTVVTDILLQIWMKSL